MRVTEVLAGVAVRESEGSLDLEALALCYDSRRATPGCLYFALPGTRADGLAFLDDAVARGAVAAVVPALRPGAGVPQARVEDARLALAQASCRWFGWPSRALQVVGVTGTNGKTTTTFLVAAALEAAGRPTGVIGTVGYRLGGETRPAPFTTPEAVELQGLLAEMRGLSIAAAVLEVSSHALEQRRAWGLECDVTVFTNLSHDHLDYHRTLERYLDAKLRLFDGRNQGESAKRAVAVVNADDPVAPRVLEAARRGSSRVVRYGRAEGVELRAARVVPHAQGTRVEVRHPGGRTELALPLIGEYNVMNALAAYGAALALGVGSEEAARGLAAAPQVPGRLERVREGQDFEVVVDYAHTPDALERVLRALRGRIAAGGRLAVVFGCGGDRDRAKRPRMGEAAARLADRVIVTSDNPRGEDPLAIIDEVVSGAPAGARIEREPDRRAAIARALRDARRGDVVLIAGKGHETTQTTGDRVVPFDDRAAARALLRGEER